MKAITAFIFSFFTLFCSKGFAQQNPEPSPIEKWRTSKEDTLKVKRTNQLAIDYSYTNIDSAIILANYSIQLSKTLKWDIGTSLAYSSLCWVQAMDANYPEALKSGEMAYELAEKIESKRAQAKALYTLSFVYSEQGNYPKALETAFKTLHVYEARNDSGNISAICGNIALIYDKLNERQKSIEYNLKALNIDKRLGDSSSIAISYGNLGMEYSALKDFDKAENYYEKSLQMFELQGNKLYAANQYGNLAEVYENKLEFGKALDNLLKTLKIHQELDNKLYIRYAYSALSKLYFSIPDSLLHQINCTTQLRNEIGLDYANKALSIAKEIQDLDGEQNAYKLLSDTYERLGKSEMALQAYKNYILMRDSIQGIEVKKNITRKEMQYEFDKKEAATKAEQDKKDIRQRNIRNFIIAGLAGALIFLLVVFRQRNKISKARKRSDELLLNILPSEVAEELKEKGSADAKLFDDVTVMFTDFKGFTQISEKLSPTELVNEIHACFKAFDNIISKHNIEKIKTIGDSYMCAGGLPVANKTNAEDIVKAALEIQEYMNTPRDTDALSDGEVSPSGRFRGAVRIGIHTGPVVAGIVGVKKFAYDIWGDTVNIASRMESSGEAGKVNISGSTYELVKDKFKTKYRGEIETKGKGMMTMYFVEG